MCLKPNDNNVFLFKNIITYTYTRYIPQNKNFVHKINERRYHFIKSIALQNSSQRTSAHNNIFTQCRIILPILSLVSYTYWISSINIYVPIDYIYLFLFYLLFLQSCTINNGFFFVILFCTCIYIYSIIHSRIHLSDKPACR